MISNAIYRIQLVYILYYSMWRSGRAGYIGGERRRSGDGRRARRLPPPLRGSDVRLGERYGQRRQDGINRCDKFTAKNTHPRLRELATNAWPRDHASKDPKEILLRRAP